MKPNHALAKKIDEEGYYREKLRKQNHGKERGQRLMEKIIQIFKWVGHFSFLHYYQGDNRFVTIDGKNYVIFKCELCDSEVVGRPSQFSRTLLQLIFFGILTCSSLVLQQPFRILIFLTSLQLLFLLLFRCIAGMIWSN